MKYPQLSILVLSMLLAGAPRADHKPAAEWSWHVHSAGIDESRLLVYQRDRHFAIYDLACDLGDLTAGEAGDGNASIRLVELQAVSSALLLVTCNVGAHSQQVIVLDLERNSPHPVFAVTGSYSASWEIQNDELWISYDEPCDTGPSVECPDGYVTVFVQYPDPAAPN